MLLFICATGSAFPTLTSIRYRDPGEKQDFHVLCRDGIFIEPEGGWSKEGRMYIAISGFEGEFV